MQITKFNQYTPTQNIVLEAMKGKKIKERKTSEYIKDLKECIIQALIILGQKQDSEQIKVLTDCLAYELKQSQSFFTVEEIKMAIDFGAKGKLCELKDLQMPVISLHNILKFIKLYNEKVRREAIAERDKQEAEKDKQISEAERLQKIQAFEEEIERAIQMTPDQLKELPTGLKASYFRHLEKSGKIVLSIEEKKKIYAECEKLVPTINRRDLGKFDSILHENTKREAFIKEIAQSLAFERYKGDVSS
jgi:hypothetical protein